MGLLLPSSFRNPLAYPAGVPGFDPRHVAAGGMAPGNGFSGIASGANFLSLLSGASGSTRSNILSSMSSSIGPATQFGNGSSLGLATFAGQRAIATPNFTVAAILSLNFTGSGDYNIFCNCGTTGSGDVVSVSSSSPYNLTLGGWGASVVDSGFSIGGNGPFFIAASKVSGTGIANGINFVVLNLTTGAVKYAQKTTSNNSSGTPNGTYNVGGGFGTGAFGFWNPTFGGMAAVMFNPTFMSLSQLLQWAADPWSFWYPQKATNYFIRTAGGGPTVWQGTAALTELSSLSANGNAYLAASAKLGASSFLTATGTFPLSANAILVTNGTLNNSSQLYRVASATLAASETLSASTGLYLAALATLANSSFFVSNGSLYKPASAVLASSSSLAPNGLSYLTASAALNEISALSAIYLATTVWQATAVLTGSGSLTATGTFPLSASTVLAASSSIAISSQLYRAASAVLSETSTCTISSQLYRTISAVLAASSSLIATTSLSLTANSTLGISGSLTATGTFSLAAFATLSETSSLTASSLNYLTASAILAETVSLSAIYRASIVWQATALFVEASTLQATGTFTLNAAAVLSESASFSAHIALISLTGQYNYVFKFNCRGDAFLDNVVGPYLAAQAPGLTTLNVFDLREGGVIQQSGYWAIVVSVGFNSVLAATPQMQFAMNMDLATVTPNGITGCIINNMDKQLLRNLEIVTVFGKYMGSGVIPP